MLLIYNFENHLHSTPCKFTAIKFFRINSRYFDFWWWLKGKRGFCCVSAYSTTSPSAPYQAAVPVPAPFGCCPGQHPLPSVQPFPVPDVHAGHDRHPRAAHHVRTTALCWPQCSLFEGKSLEIIKRTDGFMDGGDLEPFFFHVKYWTSAAWAHFHLLYFTQGPHCFPPKAEIWRGWKTDHTKCLTRRSCKIKS